MMAFVTKTTGNGVRRRGGALFGALFAVASAGFAVPATPAYAVQFELTVAFTAIQTDEAGLTITGTVTNSGTDPLYNAQVVPWADAEVITTPERLRAVTAEAPRPDSGNCTGIAADATRLTQDGVTFDPGQAADFTVRASWADLAVAPTGVQLAGVHACGSEDSWGRPVTIGAERTLVTRVTRTDSATVVLLSSPPSLLHDSLFLDDHLAAELTGRLDTLVKLAARPGMTWAIDPALFREVLTMAQGYDVQDGTTVSPGTGQAAAEAWLTAFKNLDSARGYRLPWGNPDLTLGLTNSGLDPVAAVTAAEAADPEFAHLPRLIHPGNGLADQGFLDYTSPLQPAVILAATTANATITPAGGPTTGPGEVATDGLILDTATAPFPDGPDSAGADAGLQRLQRALADNALSPRPVIRVIDSAPAAALALRLADTGGGLTPLEPIPPTQEWTAALSTGAADGPLTKAVAAPAQAAAKTIKTYGSLVEDPAGAALLTAHALATIASQAWPDDAAATRYAKAVDQSFRAVMAQVTLKAPAEVALTSRGVPFPVTVTNGLAVPVNVRVTGSSARGTSQGQITIPPTDVVTIQPGDKQTLSLNPNVIREGQATVTLQLTTPDGQSFGDKVLLPVSASASAWMGWAVVGAAFILFVVGTFLRVRTARKKRRT